MCKGILGAHHDILAIKYFTAHVHPTQYDPQKTKTNKQLSEHATFIRQIRESILMTSQLPDPIPGTPIFKPKNW